MRPRAAHARDDHLDGLEGTWASNRQNYALLNRRSQLAHLLLSVPEEVLRRAGALVAEMAGGAGGGG
ncbi:MAG: hypothetical protein ACOC92_01310 [bacterium]